MFLHTRKRRLKKDRPMDVANSLHLENDYEDDVTPEGVEFMRRRADAELAGHVFRRFVDGKAVGPELTYEQARSGAHRLGAE
jgi:hypothetical protein